MKTFKNILSEVAQPKSSEEKAFKDLHNQKPGQHPVAPDSQFSGDIGKPKAARPADQEDDSKYDTSYGDKPDQEPVLRKGRKFSQFRANESKDMTNAKALDKASAASAEGKKKVSLAKAPWEKDKTNEEAEINELDKSTLSSYIKKAHSDKDKQVAKDQYHQAKGDTMDKDDDMYNQWGKANKAAKKAKNRTAGISKAADKLAKEDVNELNRSTLGSYIKKAAKDGPGQKQSVQIFKNMGDDKRAAKLAKKAKNREAGISKATDRLVGEDLSNKVSDIAFGKWNEALSGGQKKLDHNKNGKLDGHDFAIMRAKGKKKTKVDESTSSAMKHGITQTGPDGKTRTVFKKTRNDRTDDRGNDVIGEAVKVGNMRLKNGKNVKVSKQDAKLLNDFYKNLNAKNRRDMEKVMMKDDAGFKEIVGFAREAL